MTACETSDIAWQMESMALPLRTNMPWSSFTARMIRLDVAPFHTDWFQQAGIDRPDSIARSVPKRQREYFFGRLCAQQALRMAALPATPIYNGKGRAPIWPNGIVGSITHDAKFAAAIIAPATEYVGIGIDIETVPSRDALEALVSTVLSGAELDLLQNLSTHVTLPLLITAAFSAKESFFKASYSDVGRYFDFDAVSVRTLDMARGVIELEQRQDLCEGLRAGARHPIHLQWLEPDTICTLYARLSPR